MLGYSKAVYSERLSLSAHYIYLYLYRYIKILHICVHVYTNMHTKKTLTEHQRSPVPISSLSSNTIRTLERSNVIYIFLSNIVLVLSSSYFFGCLGSISLNYCCQHLSCCAAL